MRVRITREQCQIARAILKLSVRDVSRMSGVSETTIYEFENGVREPLARTVEAIADVFVGVEFIPETRTTCATAARSKRVA